MKLRSKYKKYRRLYEQMTQLPVKYNVINTTLRSEKVIGIMVAPNWVPEKAVTEDLKHKIIGYAEEIGAIIVTKEPAFDPETTRYSAYMRVLIESKGEENDVERV